MARGPDGTARLAKLEAAYAKAVKLPKGTVLDAVPMTELMGFSWPTIRGFAEKIPSLAAQGHVKLGGRGLKWEFKPAAFIAALIAHFNREAEAAARRNRELQRKVGIDLPETEYGSSLDEVRQLINLTLAIQSRKSEQGHYTPSAEVADFLDGYNRALVEEIMGVGTEIDPTGKLSPELREQVNEALRGVATRANERATKFIEECRASAIAAGAIVSG